MPVEWIGEIKPGSKTAASGRRQTEWLKRYSALLKLADWQRLLDFCLEWTKNEPKNDGAWNSLGTAYASLKRYNDAVEAYRQAVRINPEDAKAWGNLGTVYHLSGNKTAAMEAVLVLRRLDPEKAKTLFYLIVPR